MKTFTPLRIDKSSSIKEANLLDALFKNRFIPCGPSDKASMGLIDPVSLKHDANLIVIKKEDNEENVEPDAHPVLIGSIENASHLYRKIEDTYHFVFKFEKKSVPSGIVKQELALRVEKFTQEFGFTPGRKWQKEEKENIALEFLPKVFPSSSTIPVYLDFKNSLLIIGSASRSIVESVFSFFVKHLGDLSISNIRTNKSPATVLSGWILDEDPAVGFTVDMDGIIKKQETGGTIRFSSQDMTTAEVNGHLKQGYEVDTIAVTFDSKISLFISSNLTFKKLTWLDIKNDNSDKDEDEESRFSSQKTLEVGDIGLVVDAIIHAFGDEVSVNTAEKTDQTEKTE